MSHFTVMVVTDNEFQVENALQPFHEYECTGINDKHVVFVDETEQYRKEYEDENETMPVIYDANGDRLFSKYSKEAESFYQRDPVDTWDRKFVLPEGYTLKYIPFKEYYSTFEIFMMDYHDYNGEDGEYSVMKPDGTVGRWTNPHAKWDWWVIGGRWKGKILTYKGENVDQAYKRDIDFETKAQEARLAGAEEYDTIQKIIAGRTWRTWVQCCKEDFPDDISAARDFYYEQQVVKDLREHDVWIEVDEFAQTKDEYTQMCADRAIGTFALLKDGEWFERGDMGWWGIVSDKKDDWNETFRSLLDSIPDDKFISIVDCHI